MNFQRLPLSWYIENLLCGEPFASLLYGDGEFMAASGKRCGESLAYGEVVTAKMERELQESLDDVQDLSIVRGTDESIIDPESYAGRDIEAVRSMHRRAVEAVGDRAIPWVDGTIWDTEVREGRLGPLLRILHGWYATLRPRTVVVGNEKLAKAKFLHPAEFVPIPDRNAYARIDEIERRCRIWPLPEIVVVCAGLTAIPLIMRLRKSMPGCTFLDLGSVLDVFVGLGESRGWRRELYADPKRWKEVVRKNLDGVCCAQCEGEYPC